jgi:hypothetical protein
LFLAGTLVPEGFGMHALLSVVSFALLVAAIRYGP